MKIVLSRESFLSALNTAKQAAGVKDIKPILRSIKAIVTDSACTLVATDLELGIRLEVRGVKVEEPGEAMLPPALVAALTESSDEEMTLDASKDAVILRGDRNEFEFPGEIADAFPPVPDFDVDAYHEIKGGDLCDAIRKTTFACGHDIRFGGMIAELQASAKIWASAPQHAAGLTEREKCAAYVLANAYLVLASRVESIRTFPQGTEPPDNATADELAYHLLIGFQDNLTCSYVERETAKWAVAHIVSLQVANGCLKQAVVEAYMRTNVWQKAAAPTQPSGDDAEALAVADWLILYKIGERLLSADKITEAAATIRRLVAEKAELVEKIDELECTLGDEEAAHQGTLRLWELAKAENAELHKQHDMANTGMNAIGEFGFKTLAECAERIKRLTEENTHLRAALAMSQSPCTYCQLPREEMAACKSGFPGCARADDMTGCPEFGAMLNEQRLLEENAILLDRAGWTTNEQLRSAATVIKTLELALEGNKAHIAVIEAENAALRAAPTPRDRPDGKEAAELRESVERLSRWYEWAHNHYEPAGADPYAGQSVGDYPCTEQMHDDKEAVVEAYMRENVWQKPLPCEPPPVPPGKEGDV